MCLSVLHPNLSECVDVEAFFVVKMVSFWVLSRKSCAMLVDAEYDELLMWW